MRKSKITKETIDIYNMLDFFLRCTPLGLLPFMSDEHELPTSKEIIDAIYNTPQDDLGVRITGGTFTPEAQRAAERTEPYTAIISEYGGVEQIRTVVQSWIARYPQKGEMVRLWSVKGGGGVYTMDDVAEQSDYTDPAVPYRVRKRFLTEIAYDIYISRYVLGAQ